MKTLFKLLSGLVGILFFCQSSRATGDSPTFAYKIESRIVSTNREKLAIPEFTKSCGAGPTLFKVYRTFTREVDCSVEGGTWGAYYYEFTRGTYDFNGAYTQDHYGNYVVYDACSMEYFSHLETNTWTDSWSGTPCGNTSWHYSVFNQCSSDVIQSPTVYLLESYCTQSNIPGYSSGYYRYELSDEYPTAALIGAGGEYPVEWSGGGNSAFAAIGDKTGSTPIRDFSATSQKMQFRFKVIAPAGKRFEINYEVHQDYEGKDATNWIETLTGTGTGGWSTYGPIEYQPIYKIGTRDGCEDYIGGTKSVSLLCGSLLEADGGGGCGSCRTTVGGFAPALTDYGVSVSMNLGKGDYGDEHADLLLAGFAPTNSMTTPVGLEITGNPKGVETIRSSGSLRQVKAQQTFADIVTNSPTSFDVRFYTSANAGSINSGTGLYEPTGSPFSIGTIEQIGSSNHVRLTTSNGVVRVYDYEWSTADNGWKLTSGGGARKEALHWHESSLTQTNAIMNAANQIVFQETKQYLSLADYGRVI